jgi:hypothetical protein
MLLKGVFWTNIRKHGFIRGTIGGYLMYPSIVIFLIFEVLFLKILTRVVLIFNNGVPALDKKDFVSYGRINLDDYSWFDRGNCHFCAYANGITQMVSATLDFIGKHSIDTLNESQRRRVERYLARAFFWIKPVGFIGLGFVLAFEKLLGYRKADLNVIKDDLKKVNFGQGLKSEGYMSVYRNVFKLRIVFKSFQHSLSIIESNWCPLTYANKKLLLEHQEIFISTGYDDVVNHILKTKYSETAPSPAAAGQVVLEPDGD